MKKKTTYALFHVKDRVYDTNNHLLYLLEVGYTVGLKYTEGGALCIADTVILTDVPVVIQKQFGIFEYAEWMIIPNTTREPPFIVEVRKQEKNLKRFIAVVVEM